MPEKLTGIVFDIQRLSIQDGPGIRTTVFLKGCPLSCWWCHNPESLSVAKQLVFRAHKCVTCGCCVRACTNKVHAIDNGIHKVDFSKCMVCGKCVEVCCYDALEVLGTSMTVQEVIDAVIIDKPYYRDGGGVTLSGGEPLAQPRFAIAIAKELQSRGISVCLETCGYANRKVVEEIAKYVDQFLYDYKATGNDTHKKYTGAPQTLILSNLSLLDSLGKNIVLRCPMIRGVNDTPEHLQAIIDLAKGHKNIQEVHLLPYHALGETKREQLGMDTAMGTLTLKPPSEEVRAEWMKALQTQGCNVKIL